MTPASVEAEQLLLRQVLDNLPVAVYVVNTAGDVVIHNAAAEHIWGGVIVAGQERWAKSKGFWHATGREIRPDEWASHRALSEGQTTRAELIDITTFDGSTKTIENSAAPVRDAGGTIIGAVIVNQDVTERVRAEDELARRTRQLETLSRKLIQTQEDERRAVARELHDDLGGLLVGLKLSLQRTGSDQTENIAMVDSAMRRMRDVVQTLRPPVLAELGLEAAIREHVEREAKRAGLTARLTLPPIEPRPSAAVEITCFRVVQEALTNVIRHAQARCVEVELRERAGALELIIRDDGRGFDFDAARRRVTARASYGLLSMAERVALVGGRLEIESAPGRGTTVRADLPVQGAPPVSTSDSSRDSADAV